MWDGDAGPNQISEGLEYQTAELELYRVSGEPRNDILKVGLNDQICTWKGLSGCHVKCRSERGKNGGREPCDK